MKPTIIVGAGLAGLSCAVHLHRAGRRVAVFEADDHVGERVWSDRVDGCVLDRGFQVFLDSYPEARRVLDLTALDLHPFQAGALVATGQGFRRIADPMRAPLHLLDTLRSGIFEPGDMWRVLKLRCDASHEYARMKDLGRAPSTLEFLKARGFSERAIEGFFRPFFSGVFLEDALATPADMFAFVFHTFAKGSACLPRKGMSAIPQQLAASLPPDAVRLKARVAEVRRDGVTLDEGSSLDADAVVVAADRDGAAKLLEAPSTPSRWRGTTTVYYCAASPPVPDPLIILNGTGRGLVSNVVVQTNVCPAYAAEGEALVAVNLVFGAEASSAGQVQPVMEQLHSWFGPSVRDWRLLKTYLIPHALPADFGPAASKSLLDLARRKGVHLAGDYLVNPSIDGALTSGREAATGVLAAVRAP